jgi:hypothetical protein
MDFYDRDEIDFNTKINKKLNDFLIDTMITKINIEDLKIGQIIVVYFIPYSQKYIYSLHPKFGKIYSVSDNLHEIQIINTDNKIEKLFHDGVSYYGDSLGYDYEIKQITRI